MRYSRNPDTGILEAYTDDGVFIGRMGGMGDLMGAQVTTDAEWDESKHKRDKDGKFSSTGGGGSSASSAASVSGKEMGELLKSAKRGEAPAKSNKSAKSLEEALQSAPKAGKIASGASAAPKRDPGHAAVRWDAIKADIKCDGPRMTREYAEAYAREHPEVLKTAAKYKKVLSNVRDFQKNHPDAQDGTYDALTGEPITTTGFCVTFHQNLAADNPFGGYTDDDYAIMCAIAANELGCKSVNIGYFGNPEVSFDCQDEEAAKRFAIEHNQESVFNSHTFRLLHNKRYNPDTNPIRMSKEE